MQTAQKKNSAVPVKMIWFLICIGVFLSNFLSLFAIATGKNTGRLMGDSITNSVPYMMLALGAALCMSRGCINLSLPGTMTLSALVFTACARSDMPFFPAMLLAMMTGAALGALNGIFAVQRGKSVKLATALSSFLVGFIGTGFVYVLGRGQPLRAGWDRSAVTVCCVIWIVMAVGVCFLGAIGGKKQFRTHEGDVSGVSGGNRFLWTMIAGILASLAGVFRTVQYGTFNYNMSADISSFMNITLVLLLAGILIPNMKRSYSEALFGYLAVVFAALTLGTFIITFFYMNLDQGVQIISFAVIGLLLMIPNILIYRQKKEAVPVGPVDLPADATRPGGDTAEVPGETAEPAPEEADDGQTGEEETKPEAGV